MGIGELGLLLLTNFLGGSSFLATAYALRGFSETTLVFWRLFPAAVLFLPFSVYAFWKTRLRLNDWLRLFLIGVFGYALPLIAGAEGQSLSSATHAALLMAIEPVVIVFLSALFLGESLTVLKIVALFLSILGSFLIVFQGGSLVSLMQPSYKGDGLLCLQGLFLAFYSVAGKPLLKKIDSLSFTALTTTFASFPMFFFLWPLSRALPKAALSGQVFGAIIYLSIGVTFLGTLTWNMAMERVPASQLANFIFLQPLIGVLLGVFVLKEGLTLWSVAGGALILAGVYCAVKEPRDLSENLAQN